MILHFSHSAASRQRRCSHLVLISALCASLFLIWLLAACGPVSTPAAAPATAAPAVATATALPPSPTSVPPSPTAVPPSPTAVPPSPTAVPPTATPPPPSPTPVPLTATPLPPKPTIAPRPTVVSSPVVKVQDFEFIPRNITVKAGTAVRWMAVLGTHTSTSDDYFTDPPGGPPGPNSWHYGNLTVGGAWYVHYFYTPGTYRYYCRIHSKPGLPLTPGNMNGTVTVTAQ